MTTTRFEDRLLAELQHVVAARSAGEVIAVPRRRHAPRLLLGSAATAAVAATVLLVAAGGNGVAPAFASHRQPDGSVAVTISRLSDAAGLQAQLRAAGIPAVVDYTPTGKTCQEPRGRLAAPPQGPVVASVSGSSATGGSATFRITRNMVGPGQTLVIMTSGGAGPTSVGMQTIQGPVSPCQLVNAPALPGPTSSGSAGSFSSRGPAQGTSGHVESGFRNSAP